METVARFDFDGTYIPFAADDAYIELELLDPEAGEPEEWDSWTDEFRWEPSDDDYRPSPPPEYQPTPEDLREMEAWFDRLDTLVDLAEADERADRLATMERLHAN
jgi:hypothetical protein